MVCYTSVSAPYWYTVLALARLDIVCFGTVQLMSTSTVTMSVQEVIMLACTHIALAAAGPEHSYFFVSFVVIDSPSHS